MIQIALHILVKYYQQLALFPGMDEATIVL